MKRRTLLAALTATAFMPVQAVWAQDCFDADRAMQAVFDMRHGAGIGFSGAQFAQLPAQDKWYWTANLLNAQANRAIALERDPNARSGGGILSLLTGNSGNDHDELLRREAGLYLVLDEAEACMSRSPFVNAKGVALPSPSDRAVLRVSLEEFL